MAQTIGLSHEVVLFLTMLCEKAMKEAYLCVHGELKDKIKEYRHKKQPYNDYKIFKCSTTFSMHVTQDNNKRSDSRLVLKLLLKIIFILKNTK